MIMNVTIESILNQKQKQQGQNITVFLGFTYSKHMQSNYNLIKIGDILLPIHDKTKI